MNKTRVRLLSDLHLELHKMSALDFKKEADVVILAAILVIHTATNMLN